MATPETPKSAQRKALDAADEVVLEYVAFRGFNEVFRALNAARADDATRRGALWPATKATGGFIGNRSRRWTTRRCSTRGIFSSRFFRRLDAEMTAHAQALERGVYGAYSSPP